MAFPRGIYLAGNPNPIPIGIEIIISTTNGNETTTTYKGETSQMLASYGNLAVGSQEAIMRQDGAVSTLTVRRKGAVPGQGTEVSRDTLDFSCNEIQKSIYFAPQFITLTAKDIKSIENAAQESRDNPDNYDQLYNDLLLENPLSAAAFLLIVQGQDTFTYFEPVLVYTKNVSMDYPTDLETADIGQIFSTASLPIPEGIFNLFSIPTSTLTIGVRPGYALAWLKTARMNTTADGGAQLITQFTYGAYELTLYFGTHD